MVHDVEEEASEVEEEDDEGEWQEMVRRGKANVVESILG